MVDDGEFSVLGVEAYMVGARAAASAAFEAGYALTLTPPQLKGAEAWNLLGADGVVVCDPVENDERLHTLEQLGIPVVSIERDAAHPDSPYVVAGDYAHNMTRVLDHLLEQGAQSIALLSPDASWSSTQDSLRGYLEWASEHGVEKHISLVPTDSARNDPYEATLSLLQSDNPPDAIVATAEQFRERILEACRDIGVRVPTDLLFAVTGDSSAARLGTPSVTAIDIQPAHLSELAVRMLLQRIDGQPVDGPIVSQGVLQARESSLRLSPH